MKKTAKSTRPARIPEGIREILDEDALLADGFEEAILGSVYLPAVGRVALYDVDRCLDILVKRDGMTEDEAVEYFEFNVAGAYVGPKTPLFAKVEPRRGRGRS